ncbi:MAG: nucleotide exchange factor GrpE [Clostridiales bacterium]|nr:nucleotide exchange factor GrpE [Clostridiales bacterium]
MKKDSKNPQPEVKETSTGVEKNQTELEQALTEENEKLIAEVERLTAENEKLTKTCARLQSSADKSDTYLNQLVAMKNDFESYKRRMKFNGEQAKTEGMQAVITKIFAVIDTFELAKQHLSDENLKAFQMVYDQFLQIMKECGVEEMDVMGQPFDPMKMNALSKLDRGEEFTDLVVEVYKKGYTMGDKILRYAEVIVGA